MNQEMWILRAQAAQLRQQRGEPMNIVDQLLTFNPERESIEGLVDLSCLARLWADEAERLGVEVPEGVTNAWKSVRRELKVRMAETLEEQIRQKRKTIERMTPVEERRKKEAAELEELEKRLAATGDFNAV